MSLKTKLESIKDYREVENLTREAFWNVYKPGCDEHLMVHNIRKSKGFIKELDFIVCHEDKIVGNVICTKAEVISGSDKKEVVCIGPISVHPDYQGKGIGSMLMRKAISEARDRGDKGIFLFGDPNYYSRFGFENAIKYNVQTSWGANFDAFMGLELYEGALDEVEGKLYNDPAFEIDKAELEEFEKNFPHKVKKSEEDFE